MKAMIVTCRRGSALVAVLVIVVIGVLLAAGIMARAVSRVEDSSLSLRRSGSRAMAWSGVRAAMMGLASQREMLLKGGDASLTESKAWEFADPDGPGIWKVSLVPLDDQGTLAMSEAALINVNTASEEQLAKVGGLGSSGAAGVMGRRARGPILAVEQIQINGVVQDSTSGDGATSAKLADQSQPGGGDTGTHWLTALSADPTVAIEDGRSDRLRAADLSVKDLPSEEKARQDQRLGAGAGAARVWAQRPAQEHTLSNLVTDLLGANIPPEGWGKVLDGVEVSEDSFVLGRIDISRASEPVLATLPGVTAEVASNLVRVRSTLDESGRRDLAWPVVSGAVDAKIFAGFVDQITTRSLQYRVRVEAGRTTRSDATTVESDEFGVAKNVEAALTDRCVFEAVIDVAGDQPRIAYLRDISLLDSASMVAEAMAESQTTEPAGSDTSLVPEGQERPVQDGEDAGAMDETSGRNGQEPSGLDTGLDPQGGLRTSRLEGSGGLDLGGGLDRSASGVNLDSLRSETESGSAFERDREGSDARPASAASTSDSSGRRADPRVGRWNSTSLRASQGTSSTSARFGDDSKAGAANDAPAGANSKDAANATPKPTAPAAKPPARKPPARGSEKKSSPGQSPKGKNNSSQANPTRKEGAK